MFENIRMNDKVREKLNSVAEYLKEFNNLDFENYSENCEDIIQSVSCAVCHVIHSLIYETMDYDGVVTVLKKFINNETRINKLLALASDEDTINCETIKMCLQLDITEDNMSDINRMIKSENDDFCTVLNRALLIFRHPNLGEDLFKVLQKNLDDQEAKDELSIIISKIAVFINPAIIMHKNHHKHDDSNKPVIDNCGHHTHVPNYVPKEHVQTGILPSPQISAPPLYPANHQIPNILPGQQTPGNINEKAFNAMAHINGSGEETFVSPLKMTEKMLKQATDEQSINITAGSITEKFNKRRDFVKNHLIFIDGTSDKIKEAIVSRLASDTGYKHFTKIVNETGLTNYKVDVRDADNFHLEGTGAEKVSVLNCIGGAYSVNTYGINAFTNTPPINGGISQDVINYYQNN